MAHYSSLLVEGILQLGIQAVVSKAGPKYSRELTLRLWRLQSSRRAPIEELQFKFWKLYNQHYAALMQKALLDQVPEELLLSNPGNIYNLLMMAQAKHREQSVGLIADGFREAAKKAIPIKVNEIAALVEAIRHFWDSRKSSEPNSPPPPVDPQELTAEVYALMEESYFDNHSLLVANIESDVLADRLRAIITSAVSRGATARELAADIEKGIGGPNYSGWRALRVARTEVNAMMNRINLDAMSRTGVVSSKIWLAMADNAVRDTHRAADGQEVPINQPFVVGGMPMMCPGDPAGGPKEVVNCRCFVDWNVPVSTPEGWKTINKISVGDLVLTHKCRFRKVLKTLEPQTYSGPVVTIKYTTGYISRRGAKHPRSLQVRVTPEHPILTHRGWVAAQDVTHKDTLYVAGLPCPCCGNLAPVRGTKRYCSPSCSSKHIANEMWKMDAVRRSISEKTSKQMKREFASGIRTKAQTARARQAAFDNSKPLVRQTRDLLSLNHEGQYGLMPVSVLSVFYSEVSSPRRLWNLAVEEDNSFIANGLVVHNCDMLPGINPAYIPADVDYETLLSDISGSLGQ